MSASPICIVAAAAAAAAAAVSLSASLAREAGACKKFAQEETETTGGAAKCIWFKDEKRACGSGRGRGGRGGRPGAIRALHAALALPPLLRHAGLSRKEGGREGGQREGRNVNRRQHAGNWQKDRMR